MFVYTQRKDTKKKKEKFGIEDVCFFFREILDYLMCIYMMLMLAVFPFYYEEGYNHIGTDKSTFFCRVSVNVGKIIVFPLGIYLILQLISLIRQGKKASDFWKDWKKQFTMTDWFGLFYIAALLLSYGFTPYRETALWGEKGWFMGLLPQLILVSVYFLISRFWKPRKWMFCLIFPVSAAVFLLGCLNRFGIYPLKMSSANSGFISTIGNINWYCGYAVSVFFAGVILLWSVEWKKVWTKWLLMAYVFLGFTSLITQGSDSGWVSIAVVMLVLFGMSVGDSRKMLAFWQEMTMLSVSCFLVYVIRILLPERMNFVGGITDKFTKGWPLISMTLVSVSFLILVWGGSKKGIYREKFFGILKKTAVWGSVTAVLLYMTLVSVNTLCPGGVRGLSDSPLFTFNEDWGSNRGATWATGWRCFAEQNLLHKLVGTGPDCMWEYIRVGAGENLRAMVQENFGGARLTNAHNEWLTILVNTGILGWVSFGGMMMSGMRAFLKKGSNNPFILACGFCLLGYTVNNIFSFQQSMSVGTIFVLFGIGEAFLREKN